MKLNEFIKTKLFEMYADYWKHYLFTARGIESIEEAMRQEFFIVTTTERARNKIVLKFKQPVLDANKKAILIDLSKTHTTEEIKKRELAIESIRNIILDTANAFIMLRDQVIDSAITFGKLLKLHRPQRYEELSKYIEIEEKPEEDSAALVKA